MSVSGGSEVPTVANRSRVGLLIQASRPSSLPTSIVPAAAGGLVAVGHPGANWAMLPLALVALLLLHAGVNISNDVEDAARGTDPPGKDRNSGLFNTGTMTTGAGRRLYAGCFALATVLGLTICAVQGPVLLVIGCVGVLGGLLYTAGPIPYKYLGLGEAAIVLLMGPLITQGTFTAVTGRGFAGAAFWVGIGPGLLIAAVLAANNLTDLPHDRAARARTVAVRLGFARGRVLYLALLVLVIPGQVVLWASGLFGAWMLVPLLALPLINSCARRARGAAGEGDPRLLPLTIQTAQAHIAFSALLIVAVLLDRL